MTAPHAHNIQAQILGLTDSHIHYLVQNRQYPKHNVGIHKEMLTAYNRLVSKAAKSGITIEIASGFRSFERQQHIWNNKFTGKTAIKNNKNEIIDISQLSNAEIIHSILLFSALPGTSRHHWGCDIDIYAPNLLAQEQTLQLAPWEYQPTGPMAKLTTFLQQEAKKLGFYFPYDCYRGGVSAEPWHLSYAPLAEQYQRHIDIKALKQCINSKALCGKTIVMKELPSIIQQFVVNINPALLPDKNN